MGRGLGNHNIHHTFVDPVHVQRCTIARQANLFRGTFYPDATYNPYADG